MDVFLRRCSYFTKISWVKDRKMASDCVKVYSLSSFDWLEFGVNREQLGFYSYLLLRTWSRKHNVLTTEGHFDRSFYGWRLGPMGLYLWSFSYADGCIAPSLVNSYLSGAKYTSPIIVKPLRMMLKFLFNQPDKCQANDRKEREEQIGRQKRN